MNFQLGNGSASAVVLGRHDLAIPTIVVGFDSPLGVGGLVALEGEASLSAVLFASPELAAVLLGGPSTDVVLAGEVKTEAALGGTPGTSAALEGEPEAGGAGD